MRRWTEYKFCLIYRPRQWDIAGEGRAHEVQLAQNKMITWIIIIIIIIKDIYIAQVQKLQSN